jgi:hypothetical protein
LAPECVAICRTVGIDAAKAAHSGVTKRLLPAGRFEPERPAKPPAEASIKAV